MNWCFQAIKNYAKFSGRACRREYWAFALMDIMIVWGGYFSGVSGKCFFESVVYRPIWFVRVIDDSPRSVGDIPQAS